MITEAVRYNTFIKECEEEEWDYTLCDIRLCMKQNVRITQYVREGIEEILYYGPHTEEYLMVAVY